MKMKVYIQTIVFSLATWFLLTGNAYAYVDPGSGSAIVTAILGGIAAVTFTLRKQFYKLKNIFKKSSVDQE